MSYLKLTRPLNMLLIVVLMLVVKYGFLEAMAFPTALDGVTCSLLIIATICIAAGGNVINDSYDVETDNINKPQKVLIGVKISEKSAATFYIILTSVGVITGFVLSNMIGHPSLATVFVVISALLYGYAVWFKSLFLLGNVLVSLLVAMLLLNSILFDLYPAIGDTIFKGTKNATAVLLYYALFAFSINLIREIVKDVQDVDGDHKGGRKTLPIALGRQRTVYVAFGLTVLLTIGIVFYLYEVIYDKKVMLLYFLLLIIAPLLFLIVRLWNAETKKEFTIISNGLKIVMFLGVCSLSLYRYV